MIAASSMLFVSCKKHVFNESSQSDFLDVPEENSSILYHYSSTTSANSGGPGYIQFDDYLNVYDSTEVLLTLTEGDVGGANNDTIFNANSFMYGVVGTSTFQANYTPSITSPISIHKNQNCVANSSYELELTNDKIYIKTTTKFFQSASEEEYFLTPYIVVDSIVADQTGHPDGPATNHRKVVVDVARIKNFPVRYLGYSIASGDIDEGYQFNLDFEAERLPAWSDPSQISVALILTKKTALGNILFVNANTNH